MMPENDWKKIMESYLESDRFINLMSKVSLARDSNEVYPSSEQIFRAFELTPYANVKVVIIGQDPYHGKNQANGLAFAVNPDQPAPPSLKNIIKELESDLKIKTSSYDLVKWAQAGVLLLNQTLTVIKNQPNSHQSIGWDEFVKEVINALNKKASPIVFILWGKNAQKYSNQIKSNHCVIESVHPSPLSAYRGFFGSKPFSRANSFLGDRAIDWSI